MSDLRIQSSELMVGAQHPSLADTLNRLTVVEHNIDGTHANLGPNTFFIGKFANLPAAITALGVTAPATLIINANIVTTTTTTVPENISIVVWQGGGFTKSSGGLTFNGPFSAGLYQVFFGFSPGDVTFGAGTVKEVYPEWFGNTTGDATLAVNQAIATARTITGGGKVALSKLYNVTSVNISSTAADFTKTLTIKGNGMIASGFVGTSSSSIVVDCIGSNYITFEDFGIQGVGKAGLLLARGTTSQNCSGHRFKNIWINGAFTVASEVSIASESNIYIGCKFWNTSATNNYMTFYSSGSNDELNFTSPNGTIFDSTNTDVRMFGVEFQAPFNNANVVKFYRSANYTFYSALVIAGAAIGGNLVTYKVKSGENIFDGPIKWYASLFEGTNQNAHLLDGPNSVINYFKGISSDGGYYNLSTAGSQNILTSSGDQSFLSTSQFIGAKFNNTATPIINVWYVEKSILDIRCFGAIPSTITITGAQESSTLLAAIVNEAASSVNYHSETFGTAAPITGTYANGHRHWNSSPTAGQPKSWVCTVSGTPGTWVSEGNL